MYTKQDFNRAAIGMKVARDNAIPGLMPFVKVVI